MGSLSISTVSVKELLCPLIETGDHSTTRKTYFANGVYDIWKAPATTLPAAISEFTTRLTVTLRVASGTVNPGKAITLKASHQINGTTKPLLSQGATWNPLEPTVSCPIQPPKISSGALKPTPWTFKGKLNWEIQVGDQKSTQETDLELYVLTPNIPKYLLDNGIPLRLLRLDTLLPAWMVLDDPSDNEWSTFVFRSLFRDPRLWYDSYIGASTYATYDDTTKAVTYDANGPKLQCWMELWLSDMYGLAGGAAANKKLSRYPVNCADTAALAHAIASLGTVGGPARWRMIFMSPYGFINKTHLIGRHAHTVAVHEGDWCNNPFYLQSPPYNPLMVSPPADDGRSSFGNHYYMQLNDMPGPGEKIYDSCAGPEVGLKTLDQYIKSSIDPTAGYYAPKTFANGNIRPAGPGTAANCARGPGVVNYAAAVSFSRAKPTVPSASPSLFDRMNTALGSNGTLKVPFEGSAAGNASIVSTWTFIPSAVPDKECQISIWRYLTREDAQYAFLKRVSNLELGYKRTGDDVYYEDPAIQYRVLQLSVPSSPRNDNNLMIVIEGTMTNAAVESLVVRPIKASVFNAALADNTSIMEVVSPTSTVSLSSKFNILVRPAAATHTWWRGYKINSQEGNALLLNSNVGTSDEAINLELLARRAGAEKLTITLYGPNLDQAVRIVDLTIA